MGGVSGTVHGPKTRTAVPWTMNCLTRNSSYFVLGHLLLLTAKSHPTKLLLLTLCCYTNGHVLLGAEVMACSDSVIIDFCAKTWSFIVIVRGITLDRRALMDHVCCYLMEVLH